MTFTAADLMFDRDLTVGVASILAQSGMLAEAEEYEPGMWQIRISPTNPAATYGFIAVAGETPNGLPGWVLLSTVKSISASGTVEFFTSDDEFPSIYPHLTNLGLDLNAPIDTVATMIDTVLDHVLASDGAGG